MRFKIACCLFIISFCLFTLQTAEAKKIKDRHYKFSIVVPDAMRYVKDTGAVAEEGIYYDTTAKIVLMISKRQSKFN